MGSATTRDYIVENNQDLVCGPSHLFCVELWLVWPSLKGERACLDHGMAPSVEARLLVVLLVSLSPREIIICMLYRIEETQRKLPQLCACIASTLSREFVCVLALFVCSCVSVIQG